MVGDGPNKDTSQIKVKEDNIFFCIAMMVIPLVFFIFVIYVMWNINDDRIHNEIKAIREALSTYICYKINRMNK